MAAIRESIEYGNDLCYDNRCTLCENKGRYQEANKYCQECCVFMCKQCTKNHDAFPLKARHRLTDNTQFEAEKQPSPVLCTRHPDGLIQMYCGTHDTPCCVFCKMLEHRDCGGLLQLPEAIDRIKDFINNFISDIERVLDGRKADRSRVETEAHIAERSIKDFCSKINNYLDMLEKKSLEELERKKSAFIEKIDIDIEQLECTKMKTLGEMEDFRSVSKTNEPVVFLQIKECKKAITVSKENVEDIFQAMNKERIQFQTHSQIDDYLKSLDKIGSFVEVYNAFPSDVKNACQINELALGQAIKSSSHDFQSIHCAASDSLPCGAYSDIVISDSAITSQTNPDSASSFSVYANISPSKEQAVVQSKEYVYDVLPSHRVRRELVKTSNEDNFYKYKLSKIKDCKVNEKSDKSTCNIFDICQLPDGTLLLTDAGNNKLKRCDKDYKFRDSLRLSGDPYCVCAAGPDQAVVSLRKQRKIQFIHIRKKLHQAKSFTVGDFCRGISYVGGNLNVCVGSTDGKLAGRIEVYNNNGELQYYIPQAPQRLRTVFKYMVLCEINKCRFVTMYGHDTVAALDMSGNVTESFTCDLLEQPEGLCSDGKGQIFVCGYHNNTILQISPKHKKMETILDENDGIQKPVAVHYVSDGVRKLLVSCANSAAVLIFELK